MSIMSTTIEQLELEIQSNSTSAVGGIDALSESLRRLKAATAPVSKGGVGLGAGHEHLGPVEAEKFFGVAFVKRMA